MLELGGTIRHMHFLSWVYSSPVLSVVVVSAMVGLFIKGTLTLRRLQREAAITREKLRKP
jgi:hypothetical protein